MNSPLREKYPNTFWSLFAEYSNLWSKSPYSARLHENTDQKKIRIWTLFTQFALFSAEAVAMK